MTTKSKRTAVSEILRVLRETKKPLAVHQLSIFGYSENHLATRLSDLQRAGLVKGEFPGGVPYKVWRLV